MAIRTRIAYDEPYAFIGGRQFARLAEEIGGFAHRADDVVSLYLASDRLNKLDMLIRIVETRANEFRHTAIGDDEMLATVSLHAGNAVHENGGVADDGTSRFDNQRDVLRQ